MASRERLDQTDDSPFLLFALLVVVDPFFRMTQGFRISQMVARPLDSPLAPLRRDTQRELVARRVHPLEGAQAVRMSCPTGCVRAGEQPADNCSKCADSVAVAELQRADDSRDSSARRRRHRANTSEVGMREAGFTDWQSGANGLITEGVGKRAHLASSERAPPHSKSRLPPKKGSQCPSRRSHFHPSCCCFLRS